MNTSVVSIDFNTYQVFYATWKITSSKVQFYVIPEMTSTVKYTNYSS